MHNCNPPLQIFHQQFFARYHKRRIILPAREQEIEAQVLSQIKSHFELLHPCISSP